VAAAGAGLAAAFWALIGAIGNRTIEAAANGSQMGNTASFIFIILGIPSLFSRSNGN
jgi:hypothetical protein